MTETTPRLALTELTAAQAQKHVTVNEALIALDALINTQVTSMALTAPPDDPSDGDCYIVADSATGDWADYDGKLAYCIDGDWTFYTPFTGQMIYNAADGCFYRYTGSAWTPNLTVYGEFRPATANTGSVGTASYPFKYGYFNKITFSDGLIVGAAGTDDTVPHIFIDSATGVLYLQSSATSEYVTFRGSDGVSRGAVDLSDSTFNLRPATANTGSVGTTSYPFANGYFENGVTTTSDEQLKRNKSFVADSDALLTVGRHMAKHISAYQMLAAVSRKGDGARYHFGVSSQDAMAAFTAAGLDWKKYGIVCARKLEKDYLAPDGKTVLLKAGATTYYVRQEEADKLIMAALAAQMTGIWPGPAK